MNLTAEQILDILMSQTFYDFFIGPLDDFVNGDENAPSKESILATIKKEFDLGE
ncbi:MAG: hypothetical protein ACXW07_09740 [Nitrososphaeraceae archaeon]